MGRSLRRAKKSRPKVQVGVKKRNKTKPGIKPNLLKAPSGSRAREHAQQCVPASLRSLPPSPVPLPPLAMLTTPGACAGTALQGTGGKRQQVRSIIGSYGCSTTQTLPLDATPTRTSWAAVQRRLKHRRRRPLMTQAGLPRSFLQERAECSSRSLRKRRLLTAASPPVMHSLTDEVGAAEFVAACGKMRPEGKAPPQRLTRTQWQIVQRLMDAHGNNVEVCVNCHCS